MLIHTNIINFELINIFKNNFKKWKNGKTNFWWC